MQCQPAEDAGLDLNIFLAYNFTDRKRVKREGAGVSPTAHPCRTLPLVPHLDLLSEPDIFLHVEPLPPHTPHLSSFLEEPMT